MSGRHFERDLTLLSTNAAGEQGDGRGAFDPALSAAGRYLSFVSFSTNLVPEALAGGYSHVFRKDLLTGEVVLVSADAGGTPANGGSFASANAVSASGRHIAFSSDATNLVPDDANGNRDIFVKDLWSGEVLLASADAEGVQGQGSSFVASLSASGRHVAFGSDAPNLVPGDTNGASDVFVKDLRTGRVVLASADATGNEGTGPGSAYFGASVDPSLSWDGKQVAFQSYASNLVPDDTNGQVDIFVKNLRSGEVTLASTDSDGNPANGENLAPDLSANGRYVVFQSFAANFVPDDDNGTSDIFRKDTWTGRLELVSGRADGHVGNGQSVDAAISPNGRYVAFSSAASDLVPGDTNEAFDVFVRDMWTDVLTLVSAGLDGKPADFQSVGPQVTNTGDVVFASGASNLVENDTNSAYDIFLWA